MNLNMHSPNQIVADGVQITTVKLLYITGSQESDVAPARELVASLSRLLRKFHRSLYHLLLVPNIIFCYHWCKGIRECLVARI